MRGAARLSAAWFFLALGCEGSVAPDASMIFDDATIDAGDGRTDSGTAESLLNFCREALRPRTGLRRFRRRSRSAMSDSPHILQLSGQARAQGM